MKAHLEIAEATAFYNDRKGWSWTIYPEVGGCIVMWIDAPGLYPTKEEAISKGKFWIKRFGWELSHIMD